MYRGGPALAPVTEPVTEPLQMWHLLTHMSGLTYGWHHRHVTDALYRKAGFEWGAPPGLTLADCCDRWAELPLLFQPGTEWNYGVSTDVLGRVVEVLSGMSLDRFFDERILAPLKMVDTGFFVRDDQVDRAARLYGHAPGDRRGRDQSARAHGAQPARLPLRRRRALGYRAPTTCASAT